MGHKALLFQGSLWDSAIGAAGRSSTMGTVLHGPSQPTLCCTSNFCKNTGAQQHEKGTGGREGEKGKASTNYNTQLPPGKQSLGNSWEVAEDSHRDGNSIVRAWNSKRSEATLILAPRPEAEV